jgi:hypothetical protein
MPELMVDFIQGDLIGVSPRASRIRARRGSSDTQRG